MVFIVQDNLVTVLCQKSGIALGTSREVRKQEFSDDCYVEGLDSWRTRNEIMSLAVVAGVASVAFYPFQKGCLWQHCIVLEIIIMYIAVRT
jgi:VIT1/CCC1 family predicted Fe2+/Mn2+ transporter